MSDPAASLSIAKLFIDADPVVKGVLLLLAAYTYGKALDIGGPDEYVHWTWFGLKDLRGPSYIDTRQRLVLSYVADLPVGRGKRFIGNAKGPLDKQLVRQSMIKDWSEAYQGERNESGRMVLLAHLDALIATRLRPIPPKGPPAPRRRVRPHRPWLARRRLGRRQDPGCLSLPVRSPSSFGRPQPDRGPAQ